MEEVDSTFRCSNKSLTSGDIDVAILNLQTEDNIETPSVEEEQEEVSSLEYSQDDSFQSRRLSLELTDPLEMTCDKLTPRSSVSFWTCCCGYKPSNILLGIGISLLFVGILIGALSPFF